MAIKNSVQYAKEIAVPMEVRAPEEILGRVRVAYGTYVCSTFNNGDTLNFFTLPPKANVLFGFVEQDALGAGTVLDIGYSGALEAVAKDLDTSAAARVYLPEAVDCFAGINADMGGKLIVGSLSGGNATDGKIIKLVLLFVVA